MFTYCNGGYVVLAVIAERASGTAFHELVEQRVCRPAGLTRTGFLRTDELPGDVALGYVTMDGVVRSNVFHLPVRGTGDGGISTTLDDVSAFWRGARRRRHRAARRRRRDDERAQRRPTSGPTDSASGCTRHATSSSLEGYDAGVSFHSVHDRDRRLGHTVIGNTTDGAWPVSRLLGDALATR